MTDPARRAPADVAAAAAHVAQPVFLEPLRRRRGPVALAILGVAIASIGVAAAAAYLLWAYGAGLTLAGGFLALVPLTIVLLGIRWVDRWEPEPRVALAFAFLWGAGACIVLALLFQEGLAERLLAAGLSENPTTFVQAVVGAPLNEEITKGFGVLLILLAGRRYFDGPVDGIVYAGMVAAGFAFVENITYFGNAFLEGYGVGEVFFLRGILSPFAHVLFTACTGAIIGFAARRQSVLWGIGGYVTGLIPAILLHMLWNGAASLVSDFYGYYVAVQMPLFAIAVVFVILLRRHESRLTRTHLAEYAAAGWLHPGEVDMLGTPGGRRQALRWASGHRMRAVMRGYIRDATLLAFARHRIVTGRDRIGAQYDEQVLLRQVAASRAALAVRPAA